MPAFDLGKCLHDPEFAPSREGPANRFLNIYMTVCTTDMYVRVSMYAQKIGSTDSYCREIRGFLYLRGTTAILCAYVSSTDIFYNHSAQFIALRI